MEKRQVLQIQSQGPQVVPETKEVPVPELEEGEVLIEVHGSTINPSDRLSAAGKYFPTPLPRIMGLEGTGQVIKGNGQAASKIIGKRVCFLTMKGSYANLAVANCQKCFEIDEDVPIQCAASGIVNPLTAIGMVHQFKDTKGKTQGKKGIIHTAAASALGRMLNKLCIKEGIPLLNIVRRQEQAELLKKEGAKFVIVTKGKWLEQYKTLLKEEGFNYAMDALGGGEITDKLIGNLLPGSNCYVYGGLADALLTLSNPFSLFSGTSVTGFSLFNWFETLRKEAKEDIIKNYSNYLKNECSSTLLKQYKMSDIKEAWDYGLKNATQGKILLRP